MLTALAIRNFVLIDRLDVEFGAGLCVLTGETGAGKSILLDALGLAIGARADAVAVGRDGGQRASVTATFELPDDHPVRRHLAQQDVEIGGGEPLMLRRTISAEGRSRAFINDQPVSVSALRAVGEILVEIEGQFARHGLLDQANHRQMLDAFGGLGERLDQTRGAWDDMRAAEAELETVRADIERLAKEGDFLRHAHGELAELDPRPGEEAELAEARLVMRRGEKIIEAVDEAVLLFAGDDGIESRLGRAMRAVERADEQAAGRMADALAALERTAAEASAAVEALSAARDAIDRDPGRLAMLEDRLFALRRLARKHDTDVDTLAVLKEEVAGQLAGLDAADQDLARLEERARDARARYATCAAALSSARTAAAAALDEAVAGELPSLRLGGTRFVTSVSSDAPASRGRDGVDQIRFEIASDPDLPFGPIDKVASGGELARILLALRVVLLRSNRIDTLVFDEVDAGVGGATAAAVADRLYRLAGEAQVLVVTHSPQVAARGVSHLQVRRAAGSGNGSDATTTQVVPLSARGRREEIARMLAGAEITDEARAAAGRLMAGDGQ